MVLLLHTSLTAISVKALLMILSSTLDRTRDSLVEGYYEAKDRYNEYRNRLSNRSADIIADVQREVEDLD